MAAGNIECNTELCLKAGGSKKSIGEYLPEEFSAAGAGEEKKRKLTLFYGGRVCVYDATELQARAIISMARKELEETLGRNFRSSPSWWETSSPAMKTQLANPGLSMKKSLQRFLQKRKTRVHGNIPYQHQKKENLKEEAPDSSSFS